MKTKACIKITKTHDYKDYVFEMPDGGDYDLAISSIEEILDHVKRMKTYFENQKCDGSQECSSEKESNED